MYQVFEESTASGACSQCSEAVDLPTRAATCNPRLLLRAELAETFLNPTDIFADFVEFDAGWRLVWPFRCTLSPLLAAADRHLSIGN